jgi:catechol 2,3-dioxygenase-like lactoylglutathione lyase family enzyme
MTYDCAFSHLAIGVPDIPAAARFYAEVFGFESAEGSFTAAGDDMVRLLEVPDADLEGLFMRKDGIFIELLKYTNSFRGRELPLKDNEYGFVHLSFRTSDLEETLRRVDELGGTVLHDTRIEMEMPGAEHPTTFMFVLDPYGNRIELINHLDLESVQGHRDFLRVGRLDWATRELIPSSAAAAGR